VYVPYEAVKRLLLARWEKARIKNPDLPPPTAWEIKVEWFGMLEYYATSSTDFFRFRSQFPPKDRKKITHNRYTGPRYTGKRKRSR